MTRLWPPTANPLVYTATFTATDGFDGTGTVSVTAGSYTDAAGNAGIGGSDTVAIDRLNPTVTVDIVDGSLSDSDNSSDVTFTFSEAPVGFTAADIHGRRAALVARLAGADSRSAGLAPATFTATDGFDGTGTVSVAAGSYTDAAGNAGAGGSDTVAIDRLNPTVDGRHCRWLAERQRQQLGCDLHLQRGAGRLHGRRHSRCRPATLVAARSPDGATRWSTPRRSRPLTASTAPARCRWRPAATPMRPATPASAAPTRSHRPRSTRR